MVSVHKTWETIHFIAKRKGCKSQSVELSYNHQTRKYTINTENEEMVSFNDDSITMSIIKLEALKACINYINKELLK
jgi:hypothetical protein